MTFRRLDGVLFWGSSQNVRRVREAVSANSRRSLSVSTDRLAAADTDQCNGSDVFGSDICTCRPYLLFGIEEAVKEAQNGGSGVVIYFRKEGRALGEVTKVCHAT